MTTSEKIQLSIIARIKWAFRNNGEWVLLGLFCFLCATGGYSGAAWQFVGAVNDNQKANDARLAAAQAEWNHERDYFRGRLDARNKQFGELVKSLSDQGITTGQTAKVSAEAAASAAKTLETISTDKSDTAK